MVFYMHNRRQVMMIPDMVLARALLIHMGMVWEDMGIKGIRRIRRMIIMDRAMAIIILRLRLMNEECRIHL